MITFTIPIRTVSEMNVREHWAKRAKRAKLHRATAALLLGSKLHGVSNVAVHMAKEIRITMTRIGKRRLDSDAVPCSCKFLRDGLADALQIDDGDQRISWTYAQEVGKEYAVRVQMECVI